MLKSTVNLDSAEIKQALAYQRKHLKIKLWQERAVPTEIWNGGDFFITVAEAKGTTLPLPTGVIRLIICPWCGGAIKRPNDCVMHEWLIRRSALPVKRQYLIMHEYNCILAHHQCHADHETRREFKLRCAKAQFARYGRGTIVAWVASLMLRSAETITIPTEEETRCLK